MRPNVARSLSQIDFGYADASFELEQSPRLLRQGYFDLNGNADRILSSHEYLVLGYKGAGKSAIAARTQLMAQDSPKLYWVPPPLNVADVPLDSFRGIIPDSFDALQRYELSWRLLLLASIISSGARDAGANTRAQAAMNEAQRQLKEAGVEPTSPSSLRKLRTVRVESTITLPKFYERTVTREPRSAEDHIRVWLAYMESIVETFQSQRRHFHFLDGLDDLRVVGGGRALLLGGLLNAVHSVNQLLRAGSCPVKVVLACRTDVYDRLDAPRAGKLRRDFAVEMDWYQNPRDVGNTHLIKLLNMRAKLAIPQCTNCIETFLPARLLGRPAAQAVAEQTRHTPRDILQLMKIVSKQSTLPGRVESPTALSGFADYSDTYFSDEVQDALRFYFDDVQRRRAIELLGTVRQRHFPIDDLRSRANGSSRFKGVDVEELVTVLFDTGFLGNLTPGGPTGFQPDYYRFKYRSQRASLRLDEDLVVHPGLWKALNVA